ncbi:MAG TPA: hypothetical protein VK766_07865, partial [Cytophagaceae bacterium]|nr:hypothetical protein [Cytophagaceae bacterium]
ISFIFLSTGFISGQTPYYRIDLASGAEISMMSILDTIHLVNSDSTPVVLDSMEIVLEKGTYTFTDDLLTCGSRNTYYWGFIGKVIILGQPGTIISTEGIDLRLPSRLESLGRTVHFKNITFKRVQSQYHKYLIEVYSHVDPSGRINVYSFGEQMYNPFHFYNCSFIGNGDAFFAMLDEDVEISFYNCTVRNVKRIAFTNITKNEKKISVIENTIPGLKNIP